MEVDTIEEQAAIIQETADVIKTDVKAIPYPPGQKTNLIDEDDFWAIVGTFVLIAVLFAVFGHGIKGWQIAKKTKVFFQKPEDKSGNESYREK